MIFIESRSDLDNATDRALTIASSLATVLSKNFKARNSSNEHLIDRCPTFVSREKSRRTFFGGSKAKKTLQVMNVKSSDIVLLRALICLIRMSAILKRLNGLNG